MNMIIAIALLLLLVVVIGRQFTRRAFVVSGFDLLAYALLLAIALLIVAVAQYAWSRF
jgi:hypothetical protein